jgi:hypothetical protein
VSKAKCKNCGDIIESKHRHDFVTCTCRQTADRMIKTFSDTLTQYEKDGLMELSFTQRHLATCAFETAVGRGIFLDGGNEYYRWGGNLADFDEDYKS